MNDTAKVLITVPELNKQGGISNYYEVLRDYFSPNVNYFIREGLSKYYKKHLRLFNLFENYFDYHKKLSTNEYDLIILNSSFDFRSIFRDAFFLAIAKKNSKKIIVFIRGWHRSFEKRIDNYLLFLFKFIYFRANAFIVLSSEFKQKLSQWGYHKKIFTETTVVDEKLLTDYNENKILNKFNLNKIVILFLARISKEKGIYISLEAFKNLKKRFNMIEMNIVGSGPEYNNALKYTMEHKIENVKFSGYLTGDDKKNAYENAHIYLLPTNHGEGMPNSILEAMAFGLPIITRPVAGIKDIFQNGKMGFLTNSNSSDDFASLIEKLITNKSAMKDIALFNYNYVQDHFFASRVVARLERIYNLVSGEY